MWGFPASFNGDSCPVRASLASCSEAQRCQDCGQEAGLVEGKWVPSIMGRKSSFLSPRPGKLAGGMEHELSTCVEEGFASICF